MADSIDVVPIGAYYGKARIGGNQSVEPDTRNLSCLRSVYDQEAVFQIFSDSFSMLHRTLFARAQTLTICTILYFRIPGAPTWCCHSLTERRVPGRLQSGHWILRSRLRVSSSCTCGLQPVSEMQKSRAQTRHLASFRTFRLTTSSSKSMLRAVLRSGTEFTSSTDLFTAFSEESGRCAPEPNYNVNNKLKPDVWLEPCQAQQCSAVDPTGG